MLETIWQRAGQETDSGAMSWEQFHESSKTGRYDVALSNDAVIEEMNALYESLPYRNRPFISLPETLASIDGPFADIVQARVTPRRIEARRVTLEELRTLLHMGYGVTRDNSQAAYVTRPFRTAPSGGALYPLEIYLYNRQVDGLAPGLYHYSPARNGLHLIREGDCTGQIAASLVSFQRHLATDTSLLLFITAIFPRSIFKYGNKGYRFALLEAGHVAQNVNLTATGLNMGVINIGGFYDRDVDAFLGLDGLQHSVVYMTGLCRYSRHDSDGA